MGRSECPHGKPRNCKLCKATYDKNRYSQPAIQKKRCQQVRDWQIANPDRVLASGRKSYTKNKEVCDQRVKDYNTAHPDKRFETNRKWYLKNSYSITQEQYDEMWIEQMGLCAICHKDGKASAKKNVKFGDYLHVDHDHVTHKIRNLLCFGCNSGLGKFYEDAKALRTAADYVEAGGF